MSEVTNVILTYGCGEDWPKIREHINRVGFSESRTGIDKFPESELSDQDALLGGTKGFEAGMVAGAFNHLDAERLIRAVQSAPWRSPEDVQLFVQQQWANRFTEVSLFRQEWINWHLARRGPANFLPAEPPRDTDPMDWDYVLTET